MRIAPPRSVGLRTRGPFVLVAAAVTLSAGCQAAAWCGTARPAPQLPAVERRVPPVDVSRVADPAPPPAPDARPPYYRLTAEECRHLACANAAAADLVVMAAADGTGGFLDREQPADRLRRRVAGHLAHEVRNRAAGAALELYYRLLETELLADALAVTQAEIDGVLADAKTAADAGFKESPDLVTLRKQQIELRLDQVRVRAGIARLNGELKALVGFDAPGNLLPADAIEVTPDPLDAEQAVRAGLAARPDLHALRVLADGLNGQTVEAVRQALAGLVPAVGAVTTATRVLAPGLPAIFRVFLRPEVDAMRARVRAHLAEREREAAKDIRLAVEEWAGARDLVAVAKQRVAAEAARVAELAVKRNAGVAVEAEYRRARLDVMRAEADLVREAAKWKLADVKARQAMGLLCGGAGGHCP